MKRSYTLIEMLLSIALFALLLQSLFFWYQRLNSSKYLIGNEKWVLLEERYLDQRLQKILQHADSNPYFFTIPSERGTMGSSLVFTFDNGLRNEPLLSGIVLGKLFVDSKRQALCLAIWPHPSHEVKRPNQTIVLLEDVSDLSFDFYFPPHPFKKIVDPQEVGKPHPQEGWQSSWLDDYHTLPPLVKIHVKRMGENRKIDYAFDLLYSPQHIIYNQEAS